MRKATLKTGVYMEAVPLEFLQTVVFLCVDEETESGLQRKPKATGFFVRVPIENMTDSLDYVVTARHCVDEARQYGKIYIRMNCNTGRFTEIPTDVKDWLIHDSADVATIPLLPTVLPPGVQLEQISLKLADFVGNSPDYMYVGETQFGKVEIQPRVGHQVYFMGLFTQHYGQERNLPIARFGNISRMPGNVILVGADKTESEVIAYLVEFHSIGGHSGSPVFFMYPIMVRDQRLLKLTEDKSELNVCADVILAWVSGFMGLVSGHYDIEQEARKSGDILGEIQVKMNSGIAIVTPAEAVSQLLLREDLKEYRLKLGKIVESKRAKPKLDSAKP